MARERGAKDRSSTVVSLEQRAVSISPGERQKMIAEAAYFRALARGFKGGDPMDGWLAAEGRNQSTSAYTRTAEGRAGGLRTAAS